MKTPLEEFAFSAAIMLSMVRKEKMKTVGCYSRMCRFCGVGEETHTDEICDLEILLRRAYELGMLIDG